jgi:hypothetical protein
MVFLARAAAAHWLTDAIGSYLCNDRARAELAKGKRALSVGDLPAVPEAIKLVIAAVQAGELDGAIEAVVTVGKSKSARS